MKLSFIHDVYGSQIVSRLVTGAQWAFLTFMIYPRGDNLHFFCICPSVLALALASLSARHVEENKQKLAGGQEYHTKPPRL